MQSFAEDKEGRQSMVVTWRQPRSWYTTTMQYVWQTHQFCMYCRRM